jgi:hypothetical protein
MREKCFMGHRGDAQRGQGPDYQKRQERKLEVKNTGSWKE